MAARSHRKKGGGHRAWPTNKTLAVKKNVKKTEVNTHYYY